MLKDRRIDLLMIAGLLACLLYELTR